jgi:hypothetical protein
MVGIHDADDHRDERIPTRPEHSRTEVTASTDGSSDGTDVMRPPGGAEEASDVMADPPGSGAEGTDVMVNPGSDRP